MIKIEFPANRTDIALALGQALTTIGNGGAVATATVEAFKGEAAAEQVVQEQLQAEGAGPFYWLHHESESYGTVDTLAELEAELAAGQGLVESTNKAFYDTMVAQWTAVKPETVETVQTGSDSTAAATTHTTANVDTTKRDEKGVPFNGTFCSKAASPFYGSGKRRGQWKKRQGVEEPKYDYWYEEELAIVAANTPAVEQAIETSSDADVVNAAFGTQTPQTDAAAPQDAGQLMKWVSEQQAAGNITQQQVTDSYTALQLPFDAVMNPAYPVAQNCAAIYNHLKGQI